MDPVEVCDRAECGARALVRAEFVTGPLFFCGHRWREVTNTAAQAALFVVDEQAAPTTSDTLHVGASDPQPRSPLGF
jgi:hypothetical protein